MMFWLLCNEMTVTWSINEMFGLNYFHFEQQPKKQHTTEYKSRYGFRLIPNEEETLKDFLKETLDK